MKAPPAEGSSYWPERRALGDWIPLPPVSLFRKSTLLGPCRLLYPVMRGDGYQISGASRMLPLSDATPFLSRPAGYLDVGFPGYAAMAEQLGRAPLVSPPAPAFGIGAVVARPLLWAPLNIRSDEALCHSLAGARVTSLPSVSRQAPFAMAEDAAGAAFLFAAAWGKLP